VRNSIFYRSGGTRTTTSEDWEDLIKDGRYSGIIFDCDGTLVESSQAHFQAFQTAVQAQSYEMDLEWYEARTGLDRLSILSAFSKSVPGHFVVPLAINESISAFIQCSSSVMPILETRDLVTKFRSVLKLAVATNSEADVANASLTAVGLNNHFDSIVTISNGLPAKPAPDMFLAAANNLNISAAKTLVFEDSNEGVQAGIKAGMDVIQLIPQLGDFKG
jgi:beta-phosphoglucomutase-like phosphatase (HAD superfamily)